MNKIIDKKILLNALKLIFFISILCIVVKEFISILKTFDMELFLKYANELSISNISIIIALGMISYLPLSFYDFVLKSRVNMNIQNKKLYKLSWIISSIASIAGFGGSTAIFLKSNLYKDYIEDKDLLLKESSRIVALNFTGFSMVCLIYSISKFKEGLTFNLSNIIIYIVSLYLPCLIGYLIYKTIKGSEKKDIIDSIKIMFISILEWITTLVLILGIFTILNSKIPFFKLFPIFVLAIASSIIGMTPGGIGTFDITMLLGLEALGVSSEKVLLALFLYRISYYIVPVFIGIGLYITEVNKSLSEDSKELVNLVISKISYYILIALVFISGVLAIILPVDNYINLDKNIAIHEIMYLKNLPNDICIIIGIILIVLSRLLLHRDKSVYKLTLASVILFEIMAIFLGFNYSEILFLLLVICFVVASKKEFYRHSYVIKYRQIVMCIFVGVLSYILYRAFFVGGKFDIFEILLPCISISSIVISVILTIIYNKNKSNRINQIKLSDCIDDVESIIERFGGSSYTHYVYLNDKKICINEEKDVFFQFEIQGNKLFVLGPPVGNKENFINSIEEFYNMADSYGYIPVFCAIDNDMMPHLHSIGYQFIKIGEDSSVDLESFTLEGRNMKSVRNALSRVQKEGYQFEVIEPPFNDEFLDELKKISDEWLDGRRELDFAVGKFDKNYLECSPIAIIKNIDGEIKGFTNLMPMYDNNKTLSIDLMRFSNTCNGIMDFIFVNLFMYAKDNGYTSFNMGIVPLYNVGLSKHAFLNERIAQHIYMYGNNIYSFEGLKRFKDKYCTIWNPRYFAYRKGTNLLGIIISFISMIYLPKRESNITTYFKIVKNVD